MFLRSKVIGKGSPNCLISLSWGEYQGIDLIDRYCLIEFGNGVQTGVILRITEVGTLAVRKWILWNSVWSEEAIVHPWKILKLSDQVCCALSFDRGQSPPERHQLLDA